MLLFWIAVFIVSLFILVKGSDWLLVSSEKIGLRAGMSPFIVGVIIVGIGTSMPELVSSLVAVFKGASEIVVANSVGSNITNILLIIGLATIFGRRLVVAKDLINLDLPLIALSTAIFLMVGYDGSIVLFESFFLIITYFIYFSFLIIYRGEDYEHKIKKPKLNYSDFLMLIIGILALTIGAKYLVESVVTLSQILNIGVGLITITAVAVGTSIPELIVSVKAAINKNSEVALGNIFGSNIFNILAVVGLPGLFGTLNIDSQTFNIGLPMLILSTILFVISGISRRIHVQEGALFIMLYVLFIVKLFGLF